MSTTQAVQQGLTSLNVVALPGWIFAGVFMLIVMFIWCVEIFNALKSFGSNLLFVVTGCRTNPLVETRFETPMWKASKEGGKAGSTQN